MADSYTSGSDLQVGLRSKFILLLAPSIALAPGLWIYAAWRPDMPVAFEALGWTEGVRELRHHAGLESAPPSWVLHNLPDALWAFGWGALLGLLWRGRTRNGELMFWVFVALAAIAFWEGAQALGVLPGTGDLVDVMGCCFGLAGGVALSVPPRFAIADHTLTTLRRKIP